MRKILSIFALSALTISSPLLATTPASNVSVQTPCREAGHQREQACVVVTRSVLANNPTMNGRIDTSVARNVRAQTFSVIYVYRIQRGSPNSDGGIMIQRGNDIAMMDISMTQPVKAWVTTHDGGRTWSKIVTSDMGGTISY